MPLHLQLNHRAAVTVADLLLQEVVVTVVEAVAAEAVEALLAVQEVLGHQVHQVVVQEVLVEVVEADAKNQIC